MKVSVVIVNFNGREYIEECVESVLRSNFKKFEVVVVENGSTDGSWRLLKRRYGENTKVRLVRSKENLFFAGGSNLGAKESVGKRVVFLNSDTVVDKNWLNEMVKMMKRRTDLVQPKIMTFGTDKIDCLGGKYLWPGFGKAVGRGSRTSRCRMTEYDYVNGTCFMVDREFFWELGGFDENFKYFYEDVDFCLRAKKQEARFYLAKKAVIEHKGSLSFKANVASDRVVLYYRRNRLLTVFKNFSGVEKWLRLTALGLIYLGLPRLKVSVKAMWAAFNWGMEYWFNMIRVNEVFGLLDRKKLSWLDLGSGDGHLVQLLKENGVKALGIDEKRDQKIESIKQSDKFDVVSLIHVLEHVKSPSLVLKRVGEWLKPKGLLVVEVPVVGSLSERWLGNDFLIYLDKTHRHFLKEKDFLRLFEESGWKVVKKGRVWHQFPFHLITAGFKKGWMKGVLSIFLWLPLKILSVVGLNNEMVRFYFMF